MRTKIKGFIKNIFSVKSKDAYFAQCDPLESLCLSQTWFTEEKNTNGDSDTSAKRHGVPMKNMYFSATLKI